MSTSIEKIPLSTQSPKKSSFVLRKKMSEWRCLLFFAVYNFFKHVNEIIILAVDVSYDYNWFLHLDYIWFAPYKCIVIVMNLHLLNKSVTSLTSLTSSVFVIVPSSCRCYLITARLGMVGLPIQLRLDKLWNSSILRGSGYMTSGASGVRGGCLTVLMTLSSKQAGSFYEYVLVTLVVVILGSFDYAGIILSEQLFVILRFCSSSEMFVRMSNQGYQVFYY